MATESNAPGSEEPILNVVGERVALGPLREDLLPLYGRWINDFSTIRMLGLPPAPVTAEKERDWYEGRSRGENDLMFTIYELSKEATLGILPLGTANVLARELGLPLEPEGACERILTGAAFRMDVGVATDDAGNERRFACMAGIGFDAEVVDEVGSRLKRYLRSLAFPLVALKVYFRNDRPGLRIKDGDTTHVVQYAVVANGQYYGGDFETAEDASLTSGELQVVLVEKVGRLMRPDVLAHILAKKPLDRTMKSFASSGIHAESPAARGAEVPVQIDGEVWGCLPMFFRIEPAAVEVIR